MLVSATGNMCGSAHCIRVCVVVCARVRVCARANASMRVLLRMSVGMHAAMYECVCPCAASHMPLCIYRHGPLFLPVCMDVCRDVVTLSLFVHAIVRACHISVCVPVCM